MSVKAKSLALLFIFTGLVACEESNKTPAGNNQGSGEAVPIAANSIARVATRQLSPEFRIPAAIEASQIAKPQAQVSATLVANHFTGGEIVEQGKLLVELDDRQYQAALQIAVANVQSSEAALEEADSNYERAKGLIKSGDISQLNFDNTKARYETAKANVAKAKANLNKADLDLAYTKVFAPFSGKISKPGHAVGDLLSPASPVPLFELVELDPIYAISSVRLSQYNKFIFAKQKFEKEGGKLPEVVVSFELAGGVTYPHKGRFEAWSHSSESTRGMIAARVLVPNPDGLLLPGQIVSMIGSSVEPITGMVIPQRAVFMDQQGHYVKYVDENSQVQRANIEVGIRDGNDWVVRTGLSDGQQIIVEGAQRLPTGTQVAIQK